jgi:hypothetical protein
MANVCSARPYVDDAVQDSPAAHRSTAAQHSTASPATSILAAQHSTTAEECPICLDEMPDEQIAAGRVIFLQCAQKIHKQCFWRYVRYNQHKHIIYCPCFLACGTNIRDELQRQH